MKKVMAVISTITFMLLASYELFSQSGTVTKEFGITAGAFTNFPANKNYLKENIKVLYLTPYVRTGKHEFSAGIVYPLGTHSLFSYDNINARLGAAAGYKFYIFNIYGRENMFVHYNFQYLRFSGSFNNETQRFREADTYINNVIGLGYNLFFDTKERFWLYYTLDYVITQGSYNTTTEGLHNSLWTTQYIWNNLSTNFGLSFKLTALKKKEKK